MNNLIIKSVVAFILGLLLTWFYLVMPQAFFSLDNRLRDFMFVIRGELPKSNDVVIIDIDEKSLKEYGQWPWQRDVFADLVYNLSDAGAGIIGLDIVFAEEDRSSPHRFASKYKIEKELPNYDEVLATCLSQTPVVGGYIFIFEDSDQENTPMVPAVFFEKNLKEGSVIEPTGVVLNIESIQDSMHSSGFFNNTPDEGGMIRRVPLIMKYDGVIYPSLALEMIRIYSNTNRVYVIGDEVGVQSVKFGEFEIPTDHAGRFVVNFRGPKKHFKYISAADVLSKDFNVDDIQNKFVLIGTSAVGLFDLRSIPFDNTIAGVEVHANVIDNILRGDYLYKPADILLYDLMIIWLLVVTLFILFSLIKSWIIIPAALFVLLALFQLFYTLLFEFGMVFNLLFPIVAFSITLIVSVGIDYVIASRQKEEAKRMLGKKVSPAVMDYLLQHSDEGLVVSKEIEATVFFSDIRGFTSISEKIGSPDRLIHMLNDYMTPMVENIVKNQGTIDKFIGDAIMAYWNAPIKVEGHPDRAVSCAVEQIEMLTEVNARINPQYGVNIAIGIGIHTGVVTAGDMGSFGRSDYTIIGDNVNLASRMEGLTKQYDAQILISHETYSKLKGKYNIRPIDLVEVKGKNEAVEIFEVICSNKNISDDEMALYNKAIKHFRNARLDQAYDTFCELQSQHPCKLYEFYVSRCKEFLYNPHLEFTPILKMRTK